MAFKNLLVQLDDTKACDRRVAAAVARQFREVLDGREEPEAGDKHLSEPVADKLNARCWPGQLS